MSTAVAKQHETPVQALQRILEAGKKQLAIAVGDAMDPNRMIRLACTALHQTPTLQNCSMVSIANSVMLAAQLRLEINTGLGHAWLIPYKGACTMQMGYRGLIELAHRSAEVHDVMSHLVYENDLFELEYGDAPKCIHKPTLKDRGEWIGAYARIRYHDGPPSSLYMARKDIEAIRDQTSQSFASSDHRDKSPWVRFAEEMIRKTPTKRHLKYVRLSVNDLSRAIGIDDQAEGAIDVTPKDSSRVQQEMVLEGSMLEMAEQATLELKGSREAQEQVAAEKLAAFEERAGGSAPMDLDAQNRALDAEIAEKEAKPRKRGERQGEPA